MQKKIASFFRNEFSQGAIYLTLSSVLINFCNYIYYFLIGRSLGPKGYGEIATFFSYISVLALPLTVLSTLVIQKISSTHLNQYQYTYELERFFYNKIARWWIVIFFPLIFIPFIPGITNLQPITGYLLIPLIYFSFIAEFYNAIFQGLRLFFLFSALSLLSVAIKLLGPSLNFFGLNTIYFVLLFLVFSVLLRIYLNIKILHTKYKNVSLNKKRVILPNRILSILKSRYFIITTISIFAMTLYSNVDIIVIKKFFNPVDVGLYNSWSLFGKIILYAIGPLISISFIFYSSNKSIKVQKQILMLSLFFLTIIGFLSFVVYTNFSIPIIYIFFGNKFNNVAPFLGKASIYGTLFAAIHFLNNYFLAIKSKGAMILPITLIFYVLGMILIPKNMQNFFNLNILFSLVVIALYLILIVEEHIKIKRFSK